MTGGGPVRQGKRNYDFFSELDDKLAQLTPKPQVSPDVN